MNEKKRLRKNELARINYAELTDQERQDRNEKIRMMRKLGKWINR